MPALGRGLVRIHIPDAAPVAGVFRKLTPELQRAALEAAVFRAAGEVQKAVKAAAPVGTEPTRKTRRVRTAWRGTGKERKKLRLAQPESVAYDYGHLRNNIIRRRDRKGSSSALAVTLVGIGRAFWGRFLERGTVRMRPHPFYAASVAAAEPAMKCALADAFGKAVETAALRLGGAVSKANRTRLRG